MHHDDQFKRNAETRKHNPPQPKAHKQNSSKKTSDNQTLKIKKMVPKKTLKTA